MFTREFKERMMSDSRVAKKPYTTGPNAVRVGKPAPASTEADTVVLDRSDEQLTTLEQIERTEACGAVRDQIGQVHLQAMSMSRHMARPNHMLKRNVIEFHLRQLQNATLNLQGVLEKLPFVAVLVVALFLAGCNKERDCEDCRQPSAGGTRPVCTQCQARVAVPSVYRAPETKAVGTVGNDH